MAEAGIPFLLQGGVVQDTEDGRCPLQEYLDSLEPKLLAKTLRTIDLLENNGPQLRGPYSEPLGNGIFELRTKQGSDHESFVFLLCRE